LKFFKNKIITKPLTIGFKRLNYEKTICITYDYRGFYPWIID